MKIRILYTFIVVFVITSFQTARCSELGVLGRVDTITTELNNLQKVQRAIYGYTDKKLSSITLYEASSLNSTWNPIQKLLISELNGVQSTILQNYKANANSFVNSSKNEIQLDDKSNPLFEASYLWDESTSTWKGFRNKLERTYIDSGVISSYTYSDWDSIANNWKIYTQGTINYTAFRKPRELRNASLDDNNQLVSTSKVDFSYDANNQPEYETTYTYNGGYFPIFRTHYEYSDVAPQYKETIETYNSSSATWRASQKTEQAFNNGQIVSYTVADLDTTTLVWKERFKHEFSILSSSVDSLNLVQLDNPNGTLQLTKRFKSISDNNGLTRMTSSIEKDATIISNQLSRLNIIGGSINEFYNSDDSETIKMNWNFDASKNKLQCIYYRLNDATNQLELLRTSTFGFNNSNVAVSQIKEGDVTFGPNPVSNVLQITNSTAGNLNYKILTLDGKTISFGNSTDRNTYVQTNKLLPGAYILQLSLGKSKNKSSVIIKK